MSCPSYSLGATLGPHGLRVYAMNYHPKILESADLAHTAIAV